MSASVTSTNMSTAEISSVQGTPQKIGISDDIELSNRETHDKADEYPPIGRVAVVMTALYLTFFLVALVSDYMLKLSISCYVD
jgi:hypothetical protein